MPTGIEILLATFGNFQTLLFTIFVLSAIGVGCSGFVYLMAKTSPPDENVAKGGLRTLRWFVSPAIIFGLLSCLPSIDDVWKVRIAVLKFQLASPESVNKAADHIEDIGKALECKYLNVNCPKEEKK